MGEKLTTIQRMELREEIARLALAHDGFVYDGDETLAEIAESEPRQIRAARAVAFADRVLDVVLRPTKPRRPRAVLTKDPSHD